MRHIRLFGQIHRVNGPRQVMAPLAY